MPAPARNRRCRVHAEFGGVIVTDVRLPGRSGLNLLTQVVKLDPDLPVIVVTGYGDVDMAVEAMRAGAYDFIEKPFAAERLMETVRRAEEKRRLVLENRRPQGRLEHVSGHARIDRAVGADILINGQTGTGKEVVARQLHAASGRKGPFVAINCGALPETVFESEIFGHEAGAFTSAQKRRIGKLEYANGGTVFLDEIESMPLSLQVKLLRVLQERRLERLGYIDCRIIAASKMDLLQMSAQGFFREDLYYRIGVIGIDLLRFAERRDDIPLLLAYFLQGAAIRYQRPVPQWSMAQMAQWQARDWPGNVREPRNFADRLVLGVVEAAGESAGEKAGEQIDSLPQRIDAYERMLIVDALAANDGSVAAAADCLGLPKKTLYDKLKKHQLSTGRAAE
jgi:two-component system, NtrC family, C4-dicarboxylate transport response regulator DctD